MRGLPEGQKTGSLLSEQRSEEQCLLDREYTCPICDTKFTAKAVRAGAVMSDGMDMDMRPRSKNIDTLKYRVQECPVCGYAAIERHFNEINSKEVSMLREKCLRWDTASDTENIARSYEDAYHHYRAAMRCNLIRGAKSSIRGCTALYSSWLLRGWRESLEKAGKTVSEGDPMSQKEEMKLIKYTTNNLQDAMFHEDYPICGMSEPVLDYLLAVLTYKMKNMADAQRYVTRSLQNRMMKGRVRDMAEELRDMIKAKKPLQ